MAAELPPFLVCTYTFSLLDANIYGDIFCTCYCQIVVAILLMNTIEKDITLRQLKGYAKSVAVQLPHQFGVKLHVFLQCMMVVDYFYGDN